MPPVQDVPPIPEQPPATSAVLAANLARRIHEVVGAVLAPATRCAVLDYPFHANVGDNAIWLGEQRVLRALGARVVYTANLSAYDPDRLASRLAGRGTILLHGGGNLGDLWPEHQRVREEVVAAFPDYPIVQLPQSICFRDSAALRRAKTVFDRHPNLTLLLRDQNSLAIARNTFRARSILCPDMALALGELKRAGRPRVDVVALCRSDQEAAVRALPGGKAPWKCQDWVAPPRGLRGGVWRALRRLHRYHDVLGRRGDGLYRLYGLLARQRLAYGRRLLSRGRVVVTDRLHGHLLSLLLGIPHVIMDDQYGKLRSFYETWTKPCPLGVFAGSPDAAADAVAAIVPTTAAHGRGRSVA